MTLSHLDLFSGIGGFALAAQWVGGFATQRFVEKDPFCQQVLRKNFPGVPISDDVCTYNRTDRIDLITAGFPCQDISKANPKGQGLSGDRSGLFFEILRIARLCRPKYLVLENVAALLTGRGGRDMGTVLWELSQIGFDAEWEVISACAVGAPHTRERVFLMAYPNSNHGAERVAVLGHHSRNLQPSDHKAFPELWPQPHSPPPRVVDGISSRMDRNRALGNAVVPAAAAIALQRILAMENDR